MGLLGIIIFIIVAYFLLKGLPTPPKIDNEQDLINKGYSVKEAKIEIRNQRRDLREHSRTSGYALRTANKVGRFVDKMSKK